MVVFTKAFQSFQSSSNQFTLWRYYITKNQSTSYRYKYLFTVYSLQWQHIFPYIKVFPQTLLVLSVPFEDACRLKIIALQYVKTQDQLCPKSIQNHLHKMQQSPFQSFVLQCCTPHQSQKSLL